MPRSKTFANGGKLFPADLNTIEDDYEAQDLAAAIAGGFNLDGVVRRGKSVIAGENSTSATAAFNDLGDKVVGVVVPADSVLCCSFDAGWSGEIPGGRQANDTSVSDAIANGYGYLSWFLDGTQLFPGPFSSGYTLKGGDQQAIGSVPVANPARTSYRPCQGDEAGSGLFGLSATDAQTIMGTAPTFQPVDILPATPRILARNVVRMIVTPGTYTVGIRVKPRDLPRGVGTVPATVYLKQRRLHVWTQGF